ncbi:MAG TPA: response regulator [bacterium]|nr:response regulator [bacterium]
MTAPGLPVEGSRQLAADFPVLPDTTGTPSREADERAPEPEGEESPARIPVVIVDEEDLRRALLAAALADTEKIDVVGAFADAETAIDEVRRARPRVVVLEIELRGALDGIQAGLLLRREFPDIGIVWLSARRRPYIPVSFQQTTGWAYLLKTSGTDVRNVAVAIDGVANGFVVLDPEIAAAMNRLRQAWIPRLTTLGYDVLALMAQGLNNIGIAQALGLSQQVVTRQINEIYGQLGLGERGATDRHRRVQAVLTFLRAGDAPALAAEPQSQPTDTLVEFQRRPEQVANMPQHPVLDHPTFMDRVDAEIARCLRTRRHLSMVLLSAPAPDAAARQEPVPDSDAVRRMAEELARHVRRYDLVAISADVEVALMFPEATRENAGIILGRLRAAVGAAPGTMAPLWGLATWPADGNDPGALLDTARHRLSGA